MINEGLEKLTEPNGQFIALSDRSKEIMVMANSSNVSIHSTVLKIRNDSVQSKNLIVFKNINFELVEIVILGINIKFENCILIDVTLEDGPEQNSIQIIILNCVWKTNIFSHDNRNVVLEPRYQISFKKVRVLKLIFKQSHFFNIFIFLKLNFFSIQFHQVNFVLDRNEKSDIIGMEGGIYWFLSKNFISLDKVKVALPNQNVKTFATFLNIYLESVNLEIRDSKFTSIGRILGLGYRGRAIDYYTDGIFLHIKMHN